MKSSVWIELIFIETENWNWKYCSKIIFKCVNSAVGPIFNEKIDKKWNLWVRKQCTDALFTENWSKVAATVHVTYMNSSCLWGENAWKKRKRKKRGENTETQRSIQTLPYYYYFEKHTNLISKSPFIFLLKKTTFNLIG